VGSFVVNASGEIDSVTPFAYNGVYDTGWIGLDSFTFDAGVAHYLGKAPSCADIMVRRDSDGQVFYNPKLNVFVQHGDYATGGGGGGWGEIEMPADGVNLECSDTQYQMNNLNLFGYNYLFSIDGTYLSTSSSAYQLRVILRR
jgi:hypothetical protein